MNLYKIAGLVTDMLCKYPRLTVQAEPYRINTDTEPDVILHLSDEYISRRMDETPDLDAETCEYIWSGGEFYNMLISAGGFFLHSSAVMMGGKAYLFSAPSGTGKSTHTALWCELFGERAKILNDDKPAIRIVDGKIRVFGTPWSGKTDLNINTDAALAGICFLERDVNNHIERLPSADAISKLLNQTIRPSDKTKMTELLDTLDTVIQNTPIYTMGCNISIEAAQVAYDMMKR